MSPIRRRIGHFSRGENGTLDIAILKEDFNDKCYGELNQYINFISKLQPILISYETIELSYREFLELIKKYDQHFATVIAPDAAHIGILLGYLVETTQKIINFLSSATSFLTCSEVRLKKEFGKKSKQLDEWNEHRRNLHSQNVEYRFLYEMRNYSQHYHLPVSNIGVKLNNLAIGERSTSNTIEINRDELLSSGYDWREDIKEDIKGLDEKINVAPIVESYMNSLRKIAYKYFSVYEKEIQECHHYLVALRSFFAFPANSTPVIYIGETPEGQPAPQQAEFIPFYQFNWIHKHYLQLSQHITPHSLILKSEKPIYNHGESLFA